MGFIGTQSKIILYQTKAEKHYVKNRKTIFSSIQNMLQWTIVGGIYYYLDII